MKRKVLSIVMALALCVGLLPVTVSAAVTTGDFASLKSEAEAASAAVTVPAGTYDGNGGTITLPSGVSLTIASGTTVMLKNMTIQVANGYSTTSTTKVNNAGTLIMENVNVTGNGKGLFNTGTATLIGCNFYNNSADGAVKNVVGGNVTYGYRGGAIYTDGTLIVDGCSFTDNKNTGNNSYGGAIAVLSPGKVYANNTVFSGNTAASGAWAFYQNGSGYLMNCTIKCDSNALYTNPTGAANCIILGYTYTNNKCLNNSAVLNSTTATQKGAYGYYFPVKETSDATTGGMYATYFNYEDTSNVKMGYKTTDSADITYLVGTSGLSESDKVKTDYEGGTRTANYIGASGLPYPIVTFNSNGGSAVESQQITSNSVVVAQPTNPTRDGYSFAGWYSDAGLTTAYTFGNTITESITLYAKWTITDPVTVTFNANGGSGTMAGQQVPRNIATPLDAMSGLTGPAGKPTFTGWKTAADGSGTPYADSAEITAAGNITLYAQWSALQETDAYTVTNAENLTVTLKAATVANLQAALASAAKTIIVPSSISNIPTNTELTGSGKTVILNTGVTLTTASSAAVSIQDLTIRAAEDYATTATKLTNNGTLTMENVVITGVGRGLSNPNGKVAILKNCDIYKNTYAGINNVGTLILDGCSISENSFAGNGGGINGSGTLYANNTVFAGNSVGAGNAGGAICYGTLYLLNCTFVNNACGASGSTSGALYTDNNWYAVNCVFANNKHGDALQDANKAPAAGSNNLYTNSQTWSVTGNDTRTSATAIFGSATPSVIASASRPFGYYAPILDNTTTRGGVETYFKINGSTALMGYDNGSDGITYLVGSTGLDKTSNKVTAYMESSSGRAVNTSGKYIIGASAPVLSVTYDANGGTGTMAGQTFTKGSTVTLTANNNSITRTGYTFSGWNTVAGGTGTAYADGATTESLDTGIVLYAQWTARSYTVTFNKQGGTGGSDSVTAAYDAVMPSAAMPTRTGYTFNGYYDAASGGTQYYTNAGASARNWNKDENATLYAKWTAATYTVTLNTNGGTINSGDVTSYTYGAGATLPTDVTKSGCGFGGWYVDSGFAGDAVTTIGTTDTGAKTYYAKWTTDPATAPTITTQPSSLNLTYGYTDGNTLTVAADSIDGHTLSYQWYSNTANSTTGGTAISDATSLSYTVPTGGSVGTTYYYCVVTATRTDNSEAASTTSSVATMTVGRADISPAVTMSNYTYGGTVSTPSITGNTGNGTVTYYYNTTNSNSGGTAWSGVTATSLDAGTYYLYATVAETDNYNAATTDAVSFAVGAGTWTNTTASGTAMQGANGTVDLTSCLAAGGSFGSPTTSDGIIDGTPTMSDSTLSFKFTSAAAENATATITVPVTGATNYANYSITVTVTVTSKTAQNISFADAALTKIYGDTAFTNALSGAQTTVTYSVTAGTDVASVDASTGEVTILKAGTATIAANAAASDTYLSASASYSLTVDPKSVTIPTAVTGLKWTGSVQTGVAAGTGYTVTNGTGTDVDVYTATAALSSTTNYKWSDNSTENRSIEWRIDKADGPAAPTGLSGVAPTTDGGSDGKITGVGTEMEYSSDGAAYIACTGAEVTGLSAGSYYVRVAQTATHEAGTAASVVVPAYGVTIYTITFDPNGGSVTPTSGTTGTDGKLASIPTPARAGSWSFGGWFTAASGGTRVTTATVFAADSTIYAHWAYTGGSSGDSDDSDSGYTPSTTTAPSTNTTENPDGSTTTATTQTTTRKNSDGSTTETTSEKSSTTAADGSKIETSGTTATTTKTGKDGSTTATTTVTETATSKDADGKTTGSVETRTEATETVGKGGDGTVERKTTETVRDASGKVTETTVTESKGTVETKADGTKTTMTTSTAVTTDATTGEQTTAVTTEKTVEQKDGSQGSTVKDTDGNTVSAEAKVSEQAVANAASNDESITLPVEVKATNDIADAAPVEITLPENAKSVTVEVPVENLTSGTVAVIVKTDGTEEIVRTSTTSDNGVMVTLDGSATIKIVDNTKTFIDITGDEWHADDVAWAASRELMNGVGGGKFDPNGDTTQGMMEQILYNIDGNELVAPAEGEKWWTVADNWATGESVTAGLSDAHDPSAPATREQDVLMMYNYAKSKGYNTTARDDLSRFSDADSVSSEARDAMSWAVAVGIIAGVKNANGSVTLNAQGVATRAQISAITQRFCEKVAK